MVVHGFCINWERLKSVRVPILYHSVMSVHIGFQISQNLVGQNRLVRNLKANLGNPTYTGLEIWHYSNFWRFFSKSYSWDFSVAHVFCSSRRENVRLKSVGIKPDTVLRSERSDGRSVSFRVQVWSWRYGNGRSGSDRSPYAFPLRAIPICPLKLENRIKPDIVLVLSDERPRSKKLARSFSTIDIL